MRIGGRSIVTRFYPNDPARPAKAAAIARRRSANAAYDSIRPTSTGAASPIIVQQNPRGGAALPLLAASAAFCFSLALYFPGFMSFDSAYQYWQARSGHFSNLSPVAMTALWRAVDAGWPSPAALLTLHLAAFWLGVACYVGAWLAYALAAETAEA